jgi:hypothetical protein
MHALSHWQRSDLTKIDNPLTWVPLDYSKASNRFVLSVLRRRVSS